MVNVPTCSIPDCGKPVSARGWCSMHYTRWRNNGDPLVVKRGALRADWTGDAVTYRAMHKRVVRARGKAMEHSCAGCGSAAEQWSYDNTDPNFVESVENGSTVRWSRDVERYHPLCRSCHKRLDNEDRKATGRGFRLVDLSGARNGNSRLTPEQVRDMRARYHLPHVNVSAVSREFGVSRKTVMQVLEGRSYRDVDTAS